MLAASAEKISEKLLYEDDPEKERHQRIDELLGSGKTFHVTHLSFIMSMPIRCMSMSASDRPSSQSKTLEVKFRDTYTWTQYTYTVTAVSYKTGNHKQNNAVAVRMDGAANVTASPKDIMPEGTSNFTSIGFSYKLMYLDNSKSCVVLRMTESMNDCVLLVSEEKSNAPSSTECDTIYTENCGDKNAVFNTTCKEDSTRLEVAAD